MIRTEAALVLVRAGALQEEVQRLAAAAGCETELGTDVAAARIPWVRAPLVLLDAEAAARCAAAGLPRRDGVLVVATAGVGTAPDAETWRHAVAVGAEHVVALPDGEAFLVAALGEQVERDGDGGRVVAVVGARGGAGASILAAAVSGAAAEAGRRTLLVDCDPMGGGLDLVLGVEEAAGLRWSGVALTGGRVAAGALHDALPSAGLLTVLSCGRDDVAPAPDAVAAVLDAGRRAGDVVVCDVPRMLGPAALAVLDRADATVLVVPAEVRACAAAARVVAAMGDRVATLRVVVRGPAPGGLGAADVSRALGLPVLATTRPHPGLAAQLERGGLPTRGPLPVLARTVLDSVLRPERPLVGRAA